MALVKWFFALVVVVCYLFGILLGTSIARDLGLPMALVAGGASALGGLVLAWLLLVLSRVH